MKPVELCACNGLPCSGICREINYNKGTKCSAVYWPERKKPKKTEQEENKNVYTDRTYNAR